MVVLGIDVGKSELYACLLRPALKAARQVVANTAEGHTCLQQWLEVQGVVAEATSVVMEATGVYGERIALKLHLAGYRVSVVNAAQIKFYAKSTLRRGKTDKMDAELIAQYGEKMQPARWTPPEHAPEALRALIHERDAVISLITLEKGRQHALDHREHPHELVTQLGRERLALLEVQRVALEAAMDALVAGSVELELPGQVAIVGTWDWKVNRSHRAGRDESAAGRAGFKAMGCLCGSVSSSTSVGCICGPMSNLQDRQWSIETSILSFCTHRFTPQESVGGVLPAARRSG